MSTENSVSVKFKQKISQMHMGAKIIGFRIDYGWGFLEYKLIGTNYPDINFRAIIMHYQSRPGSKTRVKKHDNKHLKSLKPY